MRRGFSILLVALVALCAQGTSAGAHASACNVLVRLDRGDGFSFDEHLTVCANGATLARFMYHPAVTRGEHCRSIPVSAAALRQVRSLLEAARFSSLRPQYLMAAGADVASYSVTYRGRTVTTDRVARLVPARLVRVVRTLNGILDARLDTPENGRKRVGRPLPAPRPC